MYILKGYGKKDKDGKYDQSNGFIFYDIHNSKYRLNVVGHGNAKGGIILGDPNKLSNHFNAEDLAKELYPFLSERKYEFIRLLCCYSAKEPYESRCYSQTSSNKVILDGDTEDYITPALPCGQIPPITPCFGIENTRPLTGSLARILSLYIRNIPVKGYVGICFTRFFLKKSMPIQAAVSVVKYWDSPNYHHTITFTNGVIHHEKDYAKIHLW
jgi:hypothetical protein